ncbi:hypothetical protein J4449_02430 [Candidatus Woesearchaeota archaeon]|nr:hypothetical protein [Candidatus Woesearchaeota archaeon]
MDHLTEEQKRRIIEKHHIKAELDLERTILAKQRTLLAEINVFLAVVGLGLLLLKFFDYLLLKIMGLAMAASSVYMITKLVHKYNVFKRKVRKIDKRNHYFH